MTIVNTPELQIRSTITEEGSTSSIQQLSTEQECAPFFVDLEQLTEGESQHLRKIGLLLPNANTIGLMKEKHVEYLTTIWRQKLRSSFLALDSSRPWMIYWCVHGLDLLDNASVSAPQTVQALHLCWTGCGGFGGGPYQMPHAATTYAAVLALSILASRSEQAVELLTSIRKPIAQWIAQLVDSTTGAARMHVDGEIDVRASYCLTVVAKLLAIPMPREDLMASFVQKCQTWEGGFGAEPGAEAHGGYTFCGVAALHLLEAKVLDRDALVGWLSRRQLPFEGGFSGRSNKLVDGCYSFWQGSASALVDSQFDAPMLERYILLCGQDVHGGLRDKPSKSRDFYHSCYCLSGLSVASQMESDSHYGSYEIHPTDFAFNIRPEHVQFVQKHFENLEL